MKERIRVITAKGQIKTANCVNRFIDWGGPTSGIGYLLQGDLFNAILITGIILVLAVIIEIYSVKAA